MTLYRLQSSAGPCTLNWIKCQQQDSYRNAWSDFIDYSFNWDLSFTSHMVHWAQWIKFGNKTVSITFISMLQPFKGKEENTAVIFYGCSAPGGSFFHKPFTEMLWSSDNTPARYSWISPELFCQYRSISFSTQSYPFVLQTSHRPVFCFHYIPELLPLTKHAGFIKTNRCLCKKRGIWQ